MPGRGQCKERDSQVVESAGDGVGRRAGRLVLGDQFVPAQVADSSALQFEFQHSPAEGCTLLSREVPAKKLGSLFLLSSQPTLPLLALVEFGIADVQYLIVQSVWWVGESGLRPQDE